MFLICSSFFPLLIFFPFGTQSCLIHQLTMGPVIDLKVNDSPSSQPPSLAMTLWWRKKPVNCRVLVQSSMVSPTPSRLPCSLATCLSVKDIGRKSVFFPKIVGSSEDNNLTEKMSHRPFHAFLIINSYRKLVGSCVMLSM